MSTHVYSISGDTLNGAVATQKLTDEIRDSLIITKALLSVSDDGADTLTIEFKEALTAPMVTELDSIVAAHDGNPGLNDAGKSRIVGSDQITPADIIDDAGTKRFAVDVGGINTINPQIAVQVFAPFSPWSAAPGTNDYVPFENLQYETQLGMHNATLDVSSTATGGTSTTLIDTAQTWTVDEWAGAIIKITSGTGEGQWREVVSNTVDTITVSGWSTTPDNTSVYYISLNNSKLVAPIGGIYSVKAHASIAYQAGPVGIFFYVNGAFKALHYTHQGQTIELNGYFSRDLELAKDDIVQMKLYNGDSVDRNMFGGEFRLWFSMAKI